MDGGDMEILDIKENGEIQTFNFGTLAVVSGCGVEAKRQFFCIRGNFKENVK